MSSRLEFLLFRLVQGFLLLMPLKSVQRIGAGLGALVYAIAPGRRNVALENLRHAFPEKSPNELAKIARGAFQNYATALLEFLWLPNMDEKNLSRAVHFHNITLMQEMYERGKGVVVITAHYGNWELNAFASRAVSKLPISIVVQTQSNRLVDDAINALRSQSGSMIVPMGISVREIIRALGKGEIVALAADQSGPEQGPYVDFFGRTASTHQGPAVFALRSGAPLLLTLAERRDDGSYDIVYEEVPSSDLSGLSPENVQVLTERHVKMLEEHIRRKPHLWLWMHRRWKHLAPAEVAGGAPVHG